ncbi:MAG TPA: hypothetical protein VNB64_10615 [Solirubrobacteraceae bacterium]|nr:hypothetical protein [Solirubrobacteraceae bacterium]
MTPGDGPAISYKLLKRGTPIESSDGTRLGTTDRVLENEREHIFDGIVMDTDGIKLFIDAPEVGRITEDLVTLTMDVDEALDLRPYEPGAPEFSANPRAGRLGRFFGGSWRRR